MKVHSFPSLDLPRSPDLSRPIHCSCIRSRKPSIWLPAGYNSIIILEWLDWKFYGAPGSTKDSQGCAHMLAKKPLRSTGFAISLHELPEISYPDSKQTKQEQNISNNSSYTFEYIERKKQCLKWLTISKNWKRSRSQSMKFEVIDGMKTN